MHISFILKTLKISDLPTALDIDASEKAKLLLMRNCRTCTYHTVATVESPVCLYEASVHKKPICKKIPEIETCEHWESKLL